MRKIGRPEDKTLYAKTHKEIALELKTSRQRVAEIEKRALAKVAAFIMKQGSLALLLLGCSGPAFTAEESIYEQGNDTSTLSGGAGESQSGGGQGSEEHSGGLGGSGMGKAGSSPGGLAGGPPSQSGSGGQAMAGGSSMGEGGAGGESSQLGPSTCLANHQTLACAQVCDSSPYCQGILDCFVSKNSDLTTDCPGFNDTGYSLALMAERNCCNGNQH